MRNIIVFLSLGLLCLTLALNSCEGGTSGNKSSKANAGPPGAATYKKYCVNCHGSNGKMGLNGAADLSASIISKEEAVEVITHGRKLMASYKSILTAEEIDEVALYILTLRQ